MSFACPIKDCTRLFTRKDNVYSHIRKQHTEWSEDDVLRYQQEKRKEETIVRQAANPFPCPHCYEKHSSKKRLQEHIGNSHPELIEKKAKPTVECPLESCDEILWTREGLADHCAEMHKEDDIDFEVEEERFGSIEEFEEWKHSLETWSAVGFVKDSIKDKRTYYWCARANRDRSDPAKDRPKKSRRENRHCSAFLTKYELPRIREMLRGYGRSSPLYYFSTRMIKDLKNRRQDREWKLHPDDHYSVLERFLQGETEGLRRADIDQSQPDLARIVTISDVQVEWLKKHFHRGVSIDDTFKTSLHKIKLLTVIVVDEFDRGLPAAHLLSYHMTEHDVEYLFREIIQVHPKFDPSFFMSDAAPALYNGFKRALPNSKASPRLDFVRWSGEGQRRADLLNHKLTLTVPRKEFTHLLTTLMDDLSDTEGDGFKDYFRPYARNRSLWAPYERSTAPFNTSMFNEAYHRELKNVWLPKGKRARLDELVHTLLTVPKIQDEDLEIEDEKGLLTGKYRLSEQYQRHRVCKEEYEGNTQKITIVSRREWKVESSRGEKEYTVTDLGGGKCDCDTHNKQNLHCWRCVACPRRFTCTCADSVKSGLNCKHVHAALTFSPITDAAPEAPPTFMDEVNEMIDHDHAFQPSIIIQEVEDDPNERVLDAMVDPAEEEERREEEKKKENIGFMRSEFYEILEQRFNFASRKTENIEELGEFIKNLKTVVSNLPVPHGRRGRDAAPRKIGDQHLKFDPPSIQTSEFVPTSRIRCKEHLNMSTELMI